MPANERRRAILEALCVRRYDTQGNLAFEFGVTQRTIRHDILELSCTYPIYTVKGCGGGVFVEEWYKLDQKFFTKEDVDLLLRLMPYADGADKARLQSLICNFAPWNRRKEKS
ncbi:MAG: DeoR family transcriptional regulator [Lachnospiraceae bacterium]|nr:DeoR family transcriptional regulator [Lachnospiraceae bacterium]